MTPFYYPFSFQEISILKRTRRLRLSTSTFCSLSNGVGNAEITPLSTDVILISEFIKYGFDAVSAVTPFYYPFSFQEICEHYKSIINAADGLPMVAITITLDFLST